MADIGTLGNPFKMKLKCKLAVCTSLMLATTAHSQSAFFHMDGDKGERQMFIANIAFTRDRTPMAIEHLLGQIAIKEIDVTVIYESPTSPEWAEMRLQFECQNKYQQRSLPEYQQATKKADKAAKKSKTPVGKVSTMAVVKGWNDPSTWNNPVKMRLAEQSFSFRRSDISQEPMVPTDWQMVSSPVLLKAHKLACHVGDEDWNAAIKTSLVDENFDSTTFNSQISKFGLTEGIQILEKNNSLYFLDLSWKTVWSGSKRPDPNGLWSKKLTSQQVATRDKEFAAMQEKMGAAVDKTLATYEPMIEQMTVEREFAEVADKFRGGRKLTKKESSLIMVWQGKPEEKVIQKMGNPNLKALNNLRVLSYGQQYDNTQAYQNVVTGQVWEEGSRNFCDVDFYTVPDAKGTWRVADVRIVAGSNTAAGSGGACDGLLKVPTL
jgi:hypothetical protein